MPRYIVKLFELVQLKSVNANATGVDISRQLLQAPAINAQLSVVRDGSL
jgi:hypothetical protein